MVHMALHYLVLVLFGLFYWVLSAEIDDKIVNAIAKRNGKKIERMMRLQNSQLYNVDDYSENNLSILRLLMKPNKSLRTSQNEPSLAMTEVDDDDDTTDGGMTIEDGKLRFNDEQIKMLRGKWKNSCAKNGAKNQILRTVQEEVRPPDTLVLAEDEDTDEENEEDDDVDEDNDYGLSIEIKNEANGAVDELNVDKEQKNILRWSGGSCSKKAAKVCKRACRNAHKFVCTIYKCSKRMKKRVKKECKQSCKRKFSSGKSKYSGSSSEGDFTFERK